MNTIGKISNIDTNLIEQVISLDANQMDFPWRQRDWVDLDWINHQLYVAIDEVKKVVGFALFHHVYGDETAHLLKICLNEESRGTGLAQALFDQSFLGLNDCGATSVYLEVEEGNARAQTFYNKLGFQLLRKIDGYYSNGKSAFTMLLSR